MKITRTILGLLLLTSLCFSCTKQDLDENENLIEEVEVFATEVDQKPPPPPEEGGGD